MIVHTFCLGQKQQPDVGINSVLLEPHPGLSGASLFPKECATHTHHTVRPECTHWPWKEERNNTQLVGLIRVQPSFGSPAYLLSILLRT